jgi:hypothetical protein
MCILLGFLVFGLMFWRGTKVLDFGVDFRGGESEQSKARESQHRKDRE